MLSLYALAGLAVLAAQGEDPIAYIQAVARGMRVRRLLAAARALRHEPLRNVPLSLQRP